jgi:hypothetical protein
MGKSAGIISLLLVGSAGLTGLGMLVDKITVENIVIAIVTLYFAIRLLNYPLVANDKMEETRALAWYVSP